MSTSTHKDIYAKARQLDLCMSARSENVCLSVKSEDIYALVIPDTSIIQNALDDWYIGALDKVFLATIDDLHFYDIYRGET